MITSRGIEIEFLPIPFRMMQKFNAANPQPKPPTYEITGLGGVKEIHEHNATTVETDAEKAALSEYFVRQNEYLEKFITFFCLRGIKVNADMTDWIEEQKYIGVPIPENKAECKFEWMINAVLSTPDDYKSVILGVMEASGVSSDLRRQVAESFRGNVPGSTASQPENTGGSMESIPEVSGSGRSDTNGDSPSEIRQTESIPESGDNGVLEHERPDASNQRARTRKRH